MNKFWCGYVIHGCLISLLQDFIGKDKYIEMVKTGWIDSKITVPLAVLGLIICAFSLYGTKERKVIKKIADFKESSWTKKVGEVEMPCLSPEHDPPKHMVFQPGVYEHTCPGCGKTTTFIVRPIMC